MKYASGRDLRAALESRIKRVAGHDNLSHVRLRKRVVFEQLLARLFTVAPDRWIVKGGVALDLDLARQDTDEAATEDLLAATELDIGDYFTFTIARDATPPTDEDIAVRYHVRAELGGKTFEAIVLDIGFGDPFPTTPEILSSPTFLGFAGLPPLTVPALPIELHVAQKLHAYTRTYSSGRSTSRVKDLIDLILICGTHSFAAHTIKDGLESTFQSRGTHILPNSVPSPPGNWATPFRKLAIEVGLDPDVETGHKIAATFLNPILAGAVEPHQIWNPERGNWS
jgi:hypothetical protein